MNVDASIGSSCIVNTHPDVKEKNYPIEQLW